MPQILQFGGFCENKPLQDKTSLRQVFCKLQFLSHSFKNFEKISVQLIKLKKWLSEKKLLVTAKRSASSDDKKPEEPPAKKIKEEPNEKTQEAGKFFSLVS